jgi:hypothetical protein
LEIVRLTKTFAYAKTLANNVKLKEHHSLRTHPWVVTGVSSAPTWRDTNELKRWIDAEVRWAQQRMLKAAESSEGPKAFAESIDSMRKATRSFFSTYATMQGELAEITADASNVLGFCARSAAVAQASANIALAWMGLLAGPATIGINWGTKSFLIASGEQVSYKFLAKKVGAGLVASFGTKVVEDWNEAVRADFAALQVLNNVPSWVDDSWHLFFQALNQGCLKTMEKNMGVQVAQVGKHTGQLYQGGMTVLGNPYTEAVAAQRNAAIRQVHQQEAAIANYAPKGGSMGEQLVKGGMKCLAWGLTIKATADSLTTLQRRWNYEL